MLRFVNVCLVLGLVAMAYVIYQVKYETRALDAQILSLDEMIDNERDAIAVLRAEWSLLNRPERIERLAKKYLKLEPAKPSQLVTVDEVTDRDFDRVHGDVAEQEPAPTPKKLAPKAAVAASAPRPEVPLAAADAWSATTTPVEASVAQ